MEKGERSPKPALALVDFDDTLVETAPAFQQAREALFARLEKEDFPRSEAEEVHHGEVEPELLALFGMGPFRMEPSFRDTYLRLCRHAGRTPDPFVAEECATLGRDFLGHPRVMERALEALAELARQVPTVLFSQASHPEYQLGRIRDAGVMEILGEERIRITHRKEAETFLDALRSYQVKDPARATMIGNSIRSDINPALAVGAGAILVEPYEMWAFDRVPPLHGNFLRLPTFPHAVAHILGNGIGS